MTGSPILDATLKQGGAPESTGPYLYALVDQDGKLVPYVHAYKDLHAAELATRGHGVLRRGGRLARFVPEGVAG